MKKPVIAIDGPSASGKGTIARLLADRLGFAYLDTGILYRAVAYILAPSPQPSPARGEGENKATSKAPSPLAGEGWGEGDINKLSISDLLKIVSETPDSELRSDEISAKASAVAKLPNIREVLTKLQREFVADPGEKYSGSVLDGRDIATVVIPDADCKLFITSDLEVRAKRRHDALMLINPKITYEEIHDNLAARDEQDRTRKIAPLMFTDDYTLLDTTNDSIEESLEKAFSIVYEKLQR